MRVLREHVGTDRRAHLLQRFHRLRHPAWMGTMRRTVPFSDAWGYDRGTPVDRYYIDRFLMDHQSDIRGRVLEVKDSGYTELYGSDVRERAVLDIDASNPRATVIADLAEADSIPSDQYDCVLLTQTLQFIFDSRGALEHARRILAPGGVLLATVPSVSRLDRRMNDYWRFTPASCQALFGGIFGAAEVNVQVYGNVLTATAFLMGLAQEELSRAELDASDPRTPVLVGVRAHKPDSGSTPEEG